MYNFSPPSTSSYPRRHPFFQESSDAGVYTRGSVRRASGFVLTGNPETGLCRVKIMYFRHNPISQHIARRTCGLAVAPDRGFRHTPRGWGCRAAFPKTFSTGAPQLIGFFGTRLEGLGFPERLDSGRLMVHNTFEHSEKTSSRKALERLKFHHVSVSG
jgi:hypothetical protein